MKKTITVFFVLLLLNAISFSQQVFKSDEYKFQITFPDDCRLYTDFGKTIPVAAYFEKYASINIVVKESEKLKGIADGEYKFENLLDSVIGIYSVNFINFRVIESGYKNISDYKFFRIMYQCDIKDKVLIAFQYFTAKNGKMYVISTGCFESDYEKYKQVFEQCVAAFTFLE